MQRSSQHILDEWLVACSQAGDKRAFERLLRRWHPRLLNYAKRQLRDQEGAKDVVQDTLLTVSKDLRKLKDPVAFPRWVYRILHRRGCDWIAAQQRQRHNEDTNVGVDVVDGDELTARAIQQGLRQLPREHYLTMYFFYLEEFSLHEIALIMDIPIGTVKSRLFTARQQLKELLGGQNE